VPDTDDRVLLAEVRGQADAEREKVLAEGRSRAAAVRAKADEEIRRLEAGQARLLEPWTGTASWGRPGSRQPNGSSRP
jgi:hypothetical protein